MESDEYDEDEDYSTCICGQMMHCYCEGHCPLREDQGICQVSIGGKCFASVEILVDDYGYDYPHLTYGCFGAGEMGMMQCKANLVPHAENKSIECCDDGDFCNKDLFPSYRETMSTRYNHSWPFAMLLSSLISCFVVVVIVLTVYITYRKKEKLAMKIDKDGRMNNNELTDDAVEEKVVRTLADLIDQSSGTGSGLPTMVQRTISNQIEMGASVGKGGFGEVFVGKWREEKVAVKVFFSAEEKSWFRETEIYQTVLMRHENILGFIAADIKGSGSWTQLLLITDYHERGSLRNFLQEHTLSPHSLLAMCTSIVRGLAHLHTEIFGIHGKPCIAHRDVNSKNILVKRNGECCVADFGLAVKFDSSSNALDVPITERTGTKRYMPPEILAERMDAQNIDALKAADMYSCGLVFWEMARRTEIGDAAAPQYALPFHEDVPTDPTFEQMREVVCVKKIRPGVPERWNGVAVLQTLTKTMRELWHGNPAARLTALRVKKTLNKLHSSRDVTIEIE